MVKKECARGSCIKTKASTEDVLKNQSTAFRSGMRKAPEEIRKFYDSGLKHIKTSSSSKKQEFVDHVLNGDFKADYFKRIIKVQKIEDFSDTESWLSWKQLVDADGEALVKIQLKQGLIDTRPHKHLDHDDPSTKDLAEEERLQYTRVQDTSSNRLSNIRSF
jgi:hypothetical protein